MKDEFTSTWPANIAGKAAEMQDPMKANRYLRRLREAAAAEHQFIHRREVQLELARETGLDLERFSLDIDSGAAEAAFQRDLEECREKHVTGFPSFQIRNREGEEFMFFGFQPYPKFVELFGRLAGSELVAREMVADDANVLELHPAARQGRLARGKRSLCAAQEQDRGAAGQGWKQPVQSAGRKPATAGSGLREVNECPRQKSFREIVSYS